ncbi:MAG: oxidative damage protection protein [Bdellovibrionales bacterium]|nr:oxidative damage protection protein [Bdellovibrionales bacterium]
MNERVVHCVKLGKELPGLAKPPFPGQVGEMIYEKISQQAWDMWQKDMQIKVINEYRLNMGDKKDYEMLVQQMLAFLNLNDEDLVEVENAERGRG